jgi:hypothetical protein
LANDLGVRHPSDRILERNLLAGNCISMFLCRILAALPTDIEVELIRSLEAAMRVPEAVRFLLPPTISVALSQSFANLAH